MPKPENVDKYGGEAGQKGVFNVLLRSFKDKHVVGCLRHPGFTTGHRGLFFVFLLRGSQRCACGAGLRTKSSKEKKEEKKLDAAGFGAQSYKRKRGAGKRRATVRLLSQGNRGAPEREFLISFSLIALRALKTFTPSTSRK